MTPSPTSRKPRMPKPRWRPPRLNLPKRKRPRRKKRSSRRPIPLPKRNPPPEFSRAKAEPEASGRSARSGGGGRRSAKPLVAPQPLTALIHRSKFIHRLGRLMAVVAVGRFGWILSKVCSIRWSWPPTALLVPTRWGRGRGWRTRRARGGWPRRPTCWKRRLAADGSAEREQWCLDNWDAVAAEVGRRAERLAWGGFASVDGGGRCGSGCRGWPRCSPPGDFVSAGECDRVAHRVDHRP